MANWKPKGRKDFYQGRCLRRIFPAILLLNLKSETQLHQLKLHCLTCLYSKCIFFLLSDIVVLNKIVYFSFVLCTFNACQKYIPKLLNVSLFKNANKVLILYKNLKYKNICTKYLLSYLFFAINVIGDYF